MSRRIPRRFARGGVTPTKNLAAPPEGDTARGVVAGHEPAEMREGSVSDDGAS